MDNQAQIEIWKRESEEGMACESCKIWGVYLPKSKRMICDCPDSPKPASDKMIEFYN